MTKKIPDYDEFRKLMIEQIHNRLTELLRSSAWNSIENPDEKIERGIDCVINEISKETGYATHVLKNIFIWDYLNQQRELFSIVGKDIFASPVSSKKIKKDGPYRLS